MGWNSWNTFYDHVSEELLLSTAEAMRENGLLEAGYRYIIVDDCWALKERDGNGRLVPDPEKFPNGLRRVADALHDMGFLFGIYSCCGTRTCAGYPGSFEHEFADARQFAEWGVDYLKYDNCFRPESVPGELLYRRMGMALQASGRDILLAACQWGTEDVWQWIRSTGAATYRSTVDIQDCWKSITDIALSQIEKQPYNGAGCFNDMDMLVVGMHGKGLNPETSAPIGGCTDEEYRTHFVLWAMLASPLMIGCDVRELSEETKAILGNRDVITINQDTANRSAFRIDVYGNPDAFVLVRLLKDGSFAMGYFNLGDVEANVSTPFWEVGISSLQTDGVRMYDCLAHQEVGVFRESATFVVPPHGCKLFRCRLEKGDKK